MSENQKPEIVETRRIVARDGNTLEIEMSQKFIDHLRAHFGLFGDQPLEDDHIRMYVWGAVNTAVTKAEQELKDAKPAGDTASAVHQPRR